MKKILPQILIFVFAFLFSEKIIAQNVTFILNPHANASICNENSFTGTVVVSSPFPTTFTLSLSAEVLNNGLPITAQCGNGNSSNNPTQILLTQLTPSIVPPNPPPCAEVNYTPTYTPNPNQYSWTVSINPSQCNGATTIEFVLGFSIFLDCSLIPQIAPLPQSQLIMNVSGNVNYNSANFPATIPGIIVPIPYIIDLVSISPPQAAQVGGNYGQTDNIEYLYKNTGLGSVTFDMDFTDQFYCSSSPTYLINSFEITIIDVSGNEDVLIV